jgi:hypothetical protein
LVLFVVGAPERRSLRLILKSPKRSVRILAALVLVLPLGHVVGLVPASIAWASHSGNHDDLLVFARRTTQRDDLRASLSSSLPRATQVLLERLGPQVANHAGWKTYAYRARVRRELKVAAPRDALLLMGVPKALCSELDPVAIRVSKRTLFWASSTVALRTCDGGDVTLERPEFVKPRL